MPERHPLNAAEKPFDDATPPSPGRTVRPLASLGMIGMSHRSAPLEEIGRCPLRRDGSAARALLSGAFDEYVVLATCNRIEVYFRSMGRGPRAAADLFLARLRGASPHADAGAFSRRYGDAAARHLLAVASGIDSLVVGETEILSQVRAAGRHAAEAGTCGPFLEKLFRDATAFGRRIRRKLPISAGPASVADLAIAEAEGCGKLGATEVLICGAGEISGKVSRRFMARESAPKTTYLLSRTAARARELRMSLLAARPDADVRVIGAASLRRVLGRVGIVVSAASADEPVIRAADIPASRADLVLIDLGVPANIDPAAHDASRRIRRVDMEDFRPLIARTLKARKKAVPDVRRAIAASVALRTSAGASMAI